MAGMLTRVVAALAIVMGLGVLTAWAWDRSESEARATTRPATNSIQAATNTAQ